MADEEANQELESGSARYRVWPLFAWLSGAVFVYIAMLGPLVYLLDQDILPGSVGRVLESTVYLPLAVLAEKSDAFSNLLQWYLELWR